MDNSKEKSLGKSKDVGGDRGRKGSRDKSRDMRRELERRVAAGEITFDPAFEREYAEMMAAAIKSSRGERKRRLLEEHGHAEKVLAYVWWQAKGNLKHLHPEYEIIDLRGGTRFADYAYLPSPALSLLLEVDGFGPHWREISRWKFDDNEERQNLLLIDDWKMLRFSYDGVAEKASRCKQTILLALASWGRPVGLESADLNVYERAILHLAMTSDVSRLTPVLVRTTLKINKRTAGDNLKSLADKSLLQTERSASGRIMAYMLFTRTRSNFRQA